MAAPDSFLEFQRGLDDPAEDAFAITPHDTNDLVAVPLKLWIGGAGSLVVETLAGTTVTIAAVPAGSEIKLRVNKVKATGTTATSIIGML